VGSRRTSADSQQLYSGKLSQCGSCMVAYTVIIPLEYSARRARNQNWLPEHLASGAGFHHSILGREGIQTPVLLLRI